MWCIKVVSTFPTHIRMLKIALSKPFDGTHLVKKNTWQVTWVRDTNSQWHIGERKDYRITSPRECLGTPPTRCDIRRKWHHAKHFDSVLSPVLRWTVSLLRSTPFHILFILCYIGWIINIDTNYGYSDLQSSSFDLHQYMGPDIDHYNYYQTVVGTWL